jgi:hypothetical protein
VSGFDGDYVVGKRLLLHDGKAEITVPQNQFDIAAEWLISRKWNLQHQFGRAWARIRSALYAPGFFDAATPVPLPHSVADHSWTGSRGVGHPGEGAGKEPPQPDGRRPREIIIRAAGPCKPWIVWQEIVFSESSETSFSVYARTAEADGSITEQSPGLMPGTPGRLNWHTVLEFVRSHDLADASGIPLQEIAIHGVQSWQRDAIAAAMLRLDAVVPFLSRLSDKELRALHDRLGGFLSEESFRLLNELAATTSSLGRGSLASIAQIVGSPDPMDAGRLAEDCAAYTADRHAERVLEQCRDAPAPTKAFLSLLHRRRPQSPQTRAGLFELWLRAEPKPKGGGIAGMLMDDELPILHWLLRDQVAEVFQAIAESHNDQLREFVSLFLDKARRYTEYFSGNYRYSSSIVYNFGRPRFAAWVGLAQEVQAAAVSLGLQGEVPIHPSLAKTNWLTHACRTVTAVNSFEEAHNPGSTDYPRQSTFANRARLKWRAGPHGLSMAKPQAAPGNTHRHDKFQLRQRRAFADMKVFEAISF